MRRLVFLFTILACVVGLSDRVMAGCKITVKAKYQTAVANPEDGKQFSYLRLDLSQSQVKKKLGWWKKLKSCSPMQPKISLGHSASSSCTLDFGCGGNRRYRFEIYGVDANGNEVYGDLIYYPSSSSWVNHKSSTTVDLGDISRAFN